MSILDIKRIRRYYAIGSLACILFAIIFEGFVICQKNALISLSFLLPLLGGIVAEALSHKIRSVKGRAKGLVVHPLEVYSVGIMVLTVGMILQGVMNIYNRSNPLMLVYWIIGAILIILGLLNFIRAFL